MQRTVLILLGAFAAGFALVQLFNPAALLRDVEENRSDEVRVLVSQFGERLQLVPLMGAPEVAAQAIQEHYAPLVHEDLVERWMYNPAEAPGRRTSSPYPDRIELDSVVKQENGSYLASGAIVEETSTGETGRTPVTATVAVVDSGVIIVAFSESDPEATSN